MDYIQVVIIQYDLHVLYNLNSLIHMLHILYHVHVVIHLMLDHIILLLLGDLIYQMLLDLISPLHSSLLFLLLYNNQIKLIEFFLLSHINQPTLIKLYYFYIILGFLIYISIIFCILYFVFYCNVLYSIM